MGLFTKKELPKWNEGKLGSITDGEVMPVTEVKDEMFAQQMLGDGVAFLSQNGIVVAPCDGTISTIFPTNHAVGIKTPDGAEILIHIGIDTVREQGKGFKGFVKQGETVKRGQKLVTFDMKQLEDKGYDLSIPMILTNMDDVEELRILCTGACKVEDEVIEYSIR